MGNSSIRGQPLDAYLFLEGIQALPTIDLDPEKLANVLVARRRQPPLKMAGLAQTGDLE
jgi:hypothetical protein